MNECVEKANTKTGQTPANSQDQSRSSIEQGFQFKDNRSEALFQRKIIRLVNRSEHVKQLVSHVNKTDLNQMKASQDKLSSVTKKAKRDNSQSNTFDEIVAQGVLQLTSRYKAVEKKAKREQVALTQNEIEEATTEIILDLLKDTDYKDSAGNSVKTRIEQGITYLFGMDYGAVEGMVTLPSIDEVTGDIKNGVYRMALSHEMSHYIRSIGTENEADSFPDVEETINQLDWDGILALHSDKNGDKDSWKEEVRADLKGIKLEYSSSRKLPSNSKIEAFGNMLGNVVDFSHPPAAFRVRAMKAHVRKIKPSSCCYLTTACVQTKGFSDDCEELRLLRQFRDEYLLMTNDGPALFDLYYQYSPAIIQEINKSKEKKIIYEYIYVVLRNCVDNINLGNMEYVFEKYKEMVVKLKEHFIPEETIQHPQLSEKF